MADEYLTLHKLEETETPFTVARIIDEDLQNSAECQLPDDVPLTLELPDLDIELPELKCDFNVDIPLVPLPYFCTPSVSGTIIITGVGGVTVQEIEPIEIGLDPASQCDFRLQGEIEIETCVAVYQATLVPLTVGCFGPETWAVVWGSSCGVTINGSGVPSSGKISPATPGTYNFVFTCCDGEGGFDVNSQTVVVPGAPTGGGITGGTDTIDVTYDAGGSSITIDAVADGCGFILTPSANVSIDCASFEISFDPGNSNGSPGTTNKVFFNGTEVGSTETFIDVEDTPQSDCRHMFKTDSKADVTIDRGLVMSTDTSGLALGCADEADLTLTYNETDGELSLSGTLPIACFSCSEGNTGSWNADIDLASLSTGSISFDNGCCAAGDAGWTQCGNLLKVGQTPAQMITLNANIADPKLTISNGSENVYIDMAHFPATDGPVEVRLREIDFCVAGEFMRRLVLCSEPYEP